MAMAGPEAVCACLGGERQEETSKTALTEVQGSPEGDDGPILFGSGPG